MNAWTRFGPIRRKQLVFPSPNIGQRGSVSALKSTSQIVHVKHVTGFAREDWGEGNWTARDLRA